MTYEEALAKKHEIQKQLEEPNKKVIIVPMLENERTKYLIFCKKFEYSDEDCREFSSNDEYHVIIKSQ